MYKLSSENADHKITQEVIPYQGNFSNESQNKEVFRAHLKNSLELHKVLKVKLKDAFSQYKVKSILNKIIKQIRKALVHVRSLSGMIDGKLKDGRLGMIYFLIKVKGRKKEKIDILLLDLSTKLDIDKALKDCFSKQQKKYKKYVKSYCNRIEFAYFKEIGKGLIDYDIENKLKLSRVELISMKESLKEKLQLRNTFELYWISQRMGLAK